MQDEHPSSYLEITQHHIKLEDLESGKQFPNLLFLQIESNYNSIVSAYIFFGVYWIFNISNWWILFWAGMRVVEKNENLRKMQKFLRITVCKGEW